ncbi:MAG TPA: deoxyribose-phosphate aldolase [Chitinophagales bacterium]|nr:deoxyribose-phosphate aldolase [Chitinophagales bacterium]HRK26186.1 deoxyribose-phosphate aldolase [Chitinophagales bacterium]
MDSIVFDAQLAAKIDHTLLKPDATAAQIDRLCKEAVQYGFAAVCVPPYYVSRAAKNLQPTLVKVATVIGFPLGYQFSEVKLQEIDMAARLGAAEMDMVVNIAAVKDGEWELVDTEIRVAAALTHQHKGILKVIFETAILTPDEIISLCRICANAQVDFVKTSTGFTGGGATPEIVQLMRQSLPNNIKVKASGGIRTRQDALAMINAGADRLGCSASVQIVEAV